MTSIETVRTDTGSKGTTKVYPTPEEATMHAHRIGTTEFFEHVVEYGGGYIVIGHLPGALLMPADESLMGRTIS